MKDRVHPLAVPVEPGEQSLDRHDLEKVALGDVAPFVAAAEPVDDDQVGMAGLVQLTGRCGPLSRRTPGSVLRATTSRSHWARAAASNDTWPAWMMSKQPLVKPTLRPRLCQRRTRVSASAMP